MIDMSISLPSNLCFFLLNFSFDILCIPICWLNSCPSFTTSSLRRRCLASTKHLLGFLFRPPCYGPPCSVQEIYMEIICICHLNFSSLVKEYITIVIILLKVRPKSKDLKCDFLPRKKKRSFFSALSATPRAFLFYRAIFCGHLTSRV